MEKLLQFIETHLRWARQTPEYATTFFNQAFGAVQFYMIEYSLNGKEFDALQAKWNETYKPAFEAVMYGKEA